jgi:hypothetical protein
VRLCDLAFLTIASAAPEEKWRRDSFNRPIVGNAQVNGFARLISADEKIREHCLRTVW